MIELFPNPSPDGPNLVLLAAPALTNDWNHPFCAAVGVQGDLAADLNELKRALLTEGDDNVFDVTVGLVMLRTGIRKHDWNSRSAL